MRNDSPGSFTRRGRVRHTRRAVKITDALARGLITVGGTGTILAVSLVCLFLVWVVIPLFLPAAVEARGEPISRPWNMARPVQVAVDEHRLIGWALLPDGRLQIFRPDNGELVGEREPFAGRAPSAWAFADKGGAAAFGFDDGRVLLGEIEYLPPQYLEEREIPAELHSLGVGETTTFQGGVLTRTSQEQFRWHQVSDRFDEIIPPAPGSPVQHLDLSVLPKGPVCCVLTADDKLSLYTVKETRNLLTGEVSRRALRTEIPYPTTALGKPAALRLSGLGNMVFLVWENGHLVRLDVSDPRRSQLAESIDLLGDSEARVTAISFLPGKSTLVVGDSRGVTSCWFTARTAPARTPDGAVLVCGHRFRGPPSPVTALAPSTRSRLLGIGHQNGTVALYQVTSEARLTQVRTSTPGEVAFLILTPKDDGFLAGTPNAITTWDLDARNPSVTLAALFLPVWYEGYEKSAHVWQSSAATDDFEAKLGLWPLVFGTLKAACYSLLFAVPLALLAALYTSEFLGPRLRSKIKPTIELMASLPSVVLGFLAALLIAPFVEQVIPATLAALFLVPFVLLFGAHLWQLLPSQLSMRLRSWRPLFMALTLPVALLVAALLGPSLESLLFAGDIRLWADGQAGTGVGAWLLLLVPLTAIVTASVLARLVNPWLRRWSAGWSRTQTAVASLVKFAIVTVVTVGLASLLAILLDGAGLDPRGTYIGTYVQRNALIVGFVMGFAIIPIIYSIAEDALSAVPEHLRSGSLAAGATPWQTALRVVIPSALSGLASAVMIGIGRAVGETMIVLMAAGNTPITEWNIFNGFRTLSANIATELPEAVRNSAHYRTLFLSALVLFLMTFVLNTAAEMIRQKFRKRAYDL
ncbi:MAG: ABC transporter permease subunit [Planctomycetota bacterium]